MKSKDERRAKPELVKNDIQLLEGYKPINLQYCPSTNLIFYQSRWKKADPAIILEKMIRQSLIISDEVFEADIEIELPTDLNEGLAVAHISATVNNQDLHQSYDITYHLQPQTSPLAAKATSQYFEGAIHLRNVKDEFMQTIRQTLENAREKGMFVTKETHGPDWMDLKITDQRIARSVGQKLQEEYGGELKVDAKHFSEDKQSGRIIYRSDITLFFFPFKKYDIFTKADEYFIALQIGKKALIENIHTNEKIKITAEDAKQYEIIAPTNIQITQIIPELKGIHPNTYQEEHINHINLECEPQTYVINEQLYLIGEEPTH